MNPVALVTGGTSGIGLCAARYLAGRGCTVYTVSRRAAGADGLRHLSADLTDPMAVARVVKQVLAEAGRIDILVNNAGFGISGAVEFTDLAAAQRQLDVNFWGMVTMTKAVLPHMRAQGGGRIVNTSSVAAPVPIPFQTFYSVSKAAINAFTMATANEVRPFGIGLCAVMPGDIHTGFTAAREKCPAGDDVYGGRIERSVVRMEHDECGGIGPQAVGRLIGKAALARRCRPLRTVGLSYKAVVVLAKLLPAAVLNRIVGRLYAK